MADRVSIFTRSLLTRSERRASSVKNVDRESRSSLFHPVQTTGQAGRQSCFAAAWDGGASMRMRGVKGKNERYHTQRPVISHLRCTCIKLKLDMSSRYAVRARAHNLPGSGFCPSRINRTGECSTSPFPRWRRRESFLPSRASPQSRQGVPQSRWRRVF